MEKSVRAFRADTLWIPKNNRYDDVLNTLKDYSYIELEIGAGVGLHPIQWAQKNPKTLVIALERTKEKFESFQRRIDSHKLKNLIGIHTDAVPWVWHLKPEIRFSKVWLLYPNPEMQKRNRRWINSPFFHHLLDRLGPDAEIEMATNVSQYAEEVTRKAQSVWRLQCDVQVYNGKPRTHFEKKYLARGEICYQIILKRT